MDNCNQTRLADDSKMYLLIEADVENFNPHAFARAIKVQIIYIYLNLFNYSIK